MSGNGISEWIRKAESDLKIGRDEIATESSANDAVCFHMQQCVEKYLKAYLIFNQKEIRRTHDLTELIAFCVEINPEFKTLFEMDADRLTEYAVDMRYPSDSPFPSLEVTGNAIKTAEAAKEFILKKLLEKGWQPG